MGIFDILNNLFPAKPAHMHNWIQFSKKYKDNRDTEYKERCHGCFRVRYVGIGYDKIERFTIQEAINDEILGFMRYAFKI